ncbi:hypothetical protein Tco_0676655 [Tanacetum coccineum]
MTLSDQMYTKNINLVFFVRPNKLDLSYSGLEEFQQLSLKVLIMRKEVESLSVVMKKTVFSTAAKIEFVRPKQHEKPVMKPMKYAEMYRLIKPVWKIYKEVNVNILQMTHSNPRRNMIPQAVLMRSGIKAVNTAKLKDAHNIVKRNRFNTVKASACWVWMPKNRVIDHMDAQAQGRQECNKEKEEYKEECSKSRKTKKMKCLEESSQQRK